MGPRAGVDGAGHRHGSRSTSATTTAALTLATPAAALLAHLSVLALGWLLLGGGRVASCNHREAARWVAGLPDAWSA